MPQNDFAEQADRQAPGLLSDFWFFLTRSKRWRLTPIIIFLLSVGALVVIGGTAAVPFIDTLF